MAQDHVAQVYSKWRKRYFQTDHFDFENTKRLITSGFYRNAPEFVLADSPVHALALILNLKAKYGIGRVDRKPITFVDTIRIADCLNYDRFVNASVFNSSSWGGHTLPSFDIISTSFFAIPVPRRGNQEFSLACGELLCQEMLHNGKLTYDQKLYTRYLPIVKKLIDLSMVAHWWFPFSRFVVVQKPPLYIKNRNGRIHSEFGPAVAYADGYSIYALNGIICPSWMTDKEDEIDPRRIVQIENAQLRAEFIKKIGAERLLHKLGSSVIDKWKTYELHRVIIPADRPRDRRTIHYLKMLNPSVPELWHVEAVSLSCKTVRAALDFRKPVKLRALPVDNKRGANWYQQGDVCIWPEDATSVKSLPIVLT